MKGKCLARDGVLQTIYFASKNLNKILEKHPDLKIDNFNINEARKC